MIATTQCLAADKLKVIQGTTSFDALATLQQWVEHQQPPAGSEASGGPSLPGVPRPLCAYPQVAYCTGSDPESAASFTCRASHNPASWSEAAQTMSAKNDVGLRMHSG